MKHYGDINKLSGYDLPVVDVITGGSPCQDLSVAGNRSGLDGERSGLFLEQVRIVKEMREHDRSTGRTNEHIRPRYLVWENVEGAFSSGKPKGADFQRVLTEIAKIVREDCPDVPLPKDGRWPKSGSVMGYGTDGCPFSIAWRLHDAQFWGVPQRRKRIALVADFGGLSAAEILFERKGMHGDPEQGEQTRKKTPTAIGRSTEESSYTLKIRGGVERDCYGKKAGKGALIQKELSGTLGVTQDQTLFPFMNTPEDGKCLNSWDVQSKHVQPTSGIAEALYAGECRYGGGESYVLDEPRAYSVGSFNSEGMKSDNPESGIHEAEKARTLDGTGGNPACYQGGIMVLEGNGSRDSHYGDGYRESEIMYTLNTVEQHKVAYSFDSLSSNSMISKNPDSECRKVDIAKTRDCFDPNPAKNQGV